MCGIFGLVTRQDSNVPSASIKSIISHLFLLSESRGKEASGLAVSDTKSIKVLRQPIRASQLLKTKECQQLLARYSNKSPLTIIGHTRLETNGISNNNNNNQPVIKDDIVGIHNGIVVNDEFLWKKYPKLKRNYLVDTEVILSLIRNFLNKKNGLSQSVTKTYIEIEGAASLALLFKEFYYLVLATNTGSLYLSCDKNFCLFASEAHILKTALAKASLSSLTVVHVKPNTGYVINRNNLTLKKFSFDPPTPFKIRPKEKSTLSLSISDASPKEAPSELKQRFLPNKKSYLPFKKEFKNFETAINKLKRCTKCVLPETVPFIKFDKDGVCNFCKNYKKMEVKGEKALREILEPYRRQDGQPDCLVTFSGGRDSSYGLHYLKRVLEMNPVAYSYDWGMITDLGRRNQSRMCGQLGIEHILIDADISRKLKFIRKNVTAWLKKPDLGMVPLFMAGDKQYFYHANRLKKQLNVKLVILCMNPLEKTDFKSGFCGIPTNFSGAEKIYTLSILNKLKLAFYYGKQYLSNLAYLNSSLLNTLSAYASYYLIPHDYVLFYQYIRWEEKPILSTLIEDYDWETAEDTSTTWRIGDGTASFYNYIYYVMAGFSENDTFRSNQLREGKINRNQALKLAKMDNQPRFESLDWYCQTIGIDLKNVLKIINTAPKLYSL